MVRRSVPDSSRWVAKLWRSVWTVTCLPKPAARRAAGADLAHAAGGEGPIGHGAREEEVARPGGLPVGAEDLQQPRGEHDVAVLLPLAAADADDHARAVDVLDAQAGDLGDPQPGGIGGHEQRRGV